MTRLLLRLSLMAAPLAFAAPASAYWEYGHQTVARIAYANVRPATRARIDRILATAPLLDTPTCPANTIEGASTWADCVKPLKNAEGKSRFGYAYNWHFQDVNICRPFELVSACKDGNCVSAQIEKDVAALRDRRTSAKDRVQALVFLIHFVGDLHQPLHAGEHDDKGGNDVAASYGGYSPARFNLHSIWDGTLAERAITTGPSLVRRYSPAEKARIAAGTVTDWSRESYQVARTVVYPSAFGHDPCDGQPAPAKAVLDNVTIERLVPVARLEVERGGLRLAKLLDRALG
ncbi:S1/P1 Nuclease [Sphingomonas gellani]|uniref:S1/P1 Nuclease n=1 Tax=Sphingomonas gellani TaxID=1166340 RepID=A0A1H8IW16_9SPHN|nr:S1/P1 nuclease [Sphingomonas gellani]SEN71888.1 S1/P1 Nuclease [Sphingomonas gellani]